LKMQIKTAAPVTIVDGWNSCKSRKFALAATNRAVIPSLAKAKPATVKAPKAWGVR
jgi:hypothetical protein